MLRLSGYSSVHHCICEDELESRTQEQSLQSTISLSGLTQLHKGSQGILA